MDPSNSTEETKKSLTRNQKLIIGGVIFAGLAALLAYFLRPDTPTKQIPPPPIIVKSGSFVLETKQKFEREANSGATWTYEMSGFKTSEIRISTYNEIHGTATYIKCDRTAINTTCPIADETTMSIWFQEYDMQAADWELIQPDSPTAIFTLGGENLTLSMADRNGSNRLNENNNKRPNRNYRYQPNAKNKVYRLGQIKVDNKIITAGSGDEFIVSMFK